MMRVLFIIGLSMTLLACLSQSTKDSSFLLKGPSTLEEAITLGQLGAQKEKVQHYDEALRLTRQAIFKTQAARQQLKPKIRDLALVWLIRWYWQLGRIFKAQNQIETAINAYQQAIQIVVPNENTFQWKTQGKITLYKKLRQMFLQLADLLLQRAAAQSTAQQQADLRLVRETIEKLKIVGLENYFAGCFANKKVKKSIDHFAAPQTAVIYPILLPERLELLVSLSLQNQPIIFQRTVSVTEKTLNQVIQNFLIQLQKGRYHLKAQDYLSLAQQLYRWLIWPLRPLLKQYDINTLVFVPEDILNALPIAALHNGNAFLIQEFAVAMTPTLNLTESSQKIASNQTKMLLNALTQAVQKYPKLHFAQKEIKAIEKLYRPSTLLNEQFTLKNLAQHLKTTHYDFIHILSHAEFAENVTESFIVTHNNKLTLNQLQNLIESNQSNQSVKLLTLSACNTAKGDKGWTALGFSGIALKAGAQSALATLWKVDDKTAFFLIKNFYHHLTSPHHLSKAQALQKAQQTILESRYDHPFYWAAFALIGNWL